VGFAKYLQKKVTLISVADRCIFGYSSKSPIGKSPWGELRDKISPLAAILLSYNIRQGVNMFLSLRNQVSVDDNTLHVQSAVTILTDGDFS